MFQNSTLLYESPYRVTDTLKAIAKIDSQDGLLLVES